MVVIEKYCEEAHIVSRGFALLVAVGPDLARRSVGARHQPAVERNQFESLNFLRSPLLDDLELFGPQVLDGIAVLVGDNHIDADEVDASPEDRLATLRCLISRRRLAGSCRSLAISRVRPWSRVPGDTGDHHCPQRDDGHRAKQPCHGFYLRPIAC